jgi:hypothetical protein
MTKPTFGGEIRDNQQVDLERADLPMSFFKHSKSRRDKILVANGPHPPIVP